MAKQYRKRAVIKANEYNCNLGDMFACFELYKIPLLLLLAVVGWVLIIVLTVLAGRKKSKQTVKKFIRSCYYAPAARSGERDSYFIQEMEQIILDKIDSEMPNVEDYEAKMIKQYGSVEKAVYSLILGLLNDMTNKLPKGKTRDTALEMKDVAKNSLDKIAEGEAEIKRDEQSEKQRLIDDETTDKALEIAREYLNKPKRGKK